MELESGIEVEAYGSKADSGESRNAEVYIQKQSERLARSDYALASNSRVSLRLR